MSTNNDLQGWDISADHCDLDSARAWMSDICGPHLLKAARPERIQFHHSGHMLRSMSTIMGYVAYGTDVTVGVGDELNLNCYSLTLPVRGEQELTKAGRLLRSDRDLGVILSPHENQELTIAGDCCELHVAIPRVAMQQTLEELLQRKVDRPLCFEPLMDAVNGATGSWWRMARHLIDELERGRDLYGQLCFTSQLENALIRGLILAQPHNYSRELQGRQEIKVPHYLLRARDFIHSNAREDLCLESIEQAAGVSRFKLFEGFKKHFGLPPMAYLKKYRLTAVRQEILEDASARNISLIAMNWGFTHLGRFASGYRKLFGETPSMTLQRHEARRWRMH
jgi:AraC-like DNA-binding protein